VTLSFERVHLPDDERAVVDFLTASTWPFHGTARLSPELAADIPVDDDELQSFWITLDDSPVGLIRLLDLGDLEDGSPLFDLRLAERHRGRGIGARAVDWLTAYLFTEFPELHRIEATTRHDNLPMQAVFASCGYRLEGRLVEAWTSTDGSRYDTLLYAILRREFVARSA
jgi:RimJ/RimL family protein N-acetyltransferase